MIVTVPDIVSILDVNPSIALDDDLVNSFEVLIMVFRASAT